MATIGESMRLTLVTLPATPNTRLPDTLPPLSGESKVNRRERLSLG